MYSNNLVNFQESTTMLNACTKKEKSRNFLGNPTYQTDEKFKELKEVFFLNL